MAALLGGKLELLPDALAVAPVNGIEAMTASWTRAGGVSVME